MILHEFQIERYGGTKGIRDIRLLESAIYRPSSNFYGEELYKSVFEKASILAVAIMLNHPFVDGNKRTGLHSMLVFLELNGFSAKIKNDLAVNLAVDIATKKIDQNKLTEILIKHSTKSN